MRIQIRHKIIICRPGKPDDLCCGSVANHDQPWRIAIYPNGSQYSHYFVLLKKAGSNNAVPGTHIDQEKENILTRIRCLKDCKNSNVGLLLTFFLLRLYVLKSFRNPRARRLLIWSLVFLILTVMIPAVEHLPIPKRLHAIAAVAFGLSLSASLYLFIRYMHNMDEQASIRSIRWVLPG